MLKNRYCAIHVKRGFFFLILIFSNHKLINLLTVNDLLVRVFVFCKYALVVFPSEMNVTFNATPFCFIIFCCFLRNIYQKYLSAKYVSKL